jgi:plasmid replication initiation protein
MKYKLIRYNTQELKELLRIFASSSLIEKKVYMNVAYEINKLKPIDWEGKNLYKIEIPMSELMERTETNYKAIARVCDRITSKKILVELPYKLKTTGKIELFKSIECCFPSCGISENTFKIEVKESVLPLFSRALERYRHYNIIEAKFLTHQNSIELYKFLKDKINQNINEFSISVENLKFELGLEDKYKQYFDFKNRVLIPAQEDMKDHSVIYFEYKEIKKNRAVSDLFIRIKTSEENEKNIYLLERIKSYIKTTTEEQFKKDFTNFIMRSYYDEDDRNKHLEPLKTKKSLKEFSEKIQLKFINFLEPA